MPTALTPRRKRSRPLSLSVLSLLRPLEWSKGVFVFFPALFYDVSLFVQDPALWGAVLASFVLFCLVASSVYVFNDLCDIESDRKHPIKRHTRPPCFGGDFAVLGLEHFCRSVVCLLPVVAPPCA